jgi:hypothetical protein
MNRERILGGALVLVLISVIACSDGFPPEFPAPDFTLKSPLTDTAVSFSELKGKPVVIYWFASW